MCVCVCVCIPAVTAQRLQCDENYNNFYIDFYSHVLLGFDSWISKLKLLSQVMASLTID